ncbi:MAG: hypothetical protein HQL18_05385, partial [Candidatus Omnitrophica bacterium]|nr:hypothetical protein [Candidatus Omnitrophota bacterium]
SIVQDTREGRIECEITEGRSWIYRSLKGVPPAPAVASARLNVSLSQDRIHALDDLMLKGIIKGRYKFAPASSPGSKRHDAVIFYFYEKPDLRAKEKLARFVTENFRGKGSEDHNLAG